MANHVSVTIVRGKGEVGLFFAPTKIIFDIRRFILDAVQEYCRLAPSKRRNGAVYNELPKIMADIAAEIEAKKSYRRALKTVRAMRKAGKSTAEIMKWARAA
jgi:hypothetical protein